MQANALPQGYKRSAWKDLDPYGRQTLLQDVIAATGRATLGTVDYLTGFEPMLYDWTTGDFWSIAGQKVNTDPISVGDIHWPEWPWWWRWAVVAALVLFFVFLVRR